MYFLGVYQQDLWCLGELGGLLLKRSIFTTPKGSSPPQVHSENMGLGGPETGEAGAGQYLYRSVERLLPVSRELLGW